MRKCAFYLCLAVCLLGCIFLSPSGWAEPAQGRGQLALLLQQLELSPEQKTQIRHIVQEARANGQDRKEMREQIGALLTEEQKAKVREFLQNRNSANSAPP